MTDDLVGAVGKADAAKAFDRTVREVGIHMFHGPKARKNAETFLKNAGLEDDFQIVRLTPLRAKAAQSGGRAREHRQDGRARRPRHRQHHARGLPRRRRRDRDARAPDDRAEGGAR
jgi:hypothetical protein